MRPRATAATRATAGVPRQRGDEPQRSGDCRGNKGVFPASGDTEAMFGGDRHPERHRAAPNGDRGAENETELSESVMTQRAWIDHDLVWENFGAMPDLCIRMARDAMDRAGITDGGLVGLARRRLRARACRHDAPFEGS